MIRCQMFYGIPFQDLEPVARIRWATLVLTNSGAKKKFKEVAAVLQASSTDSLIDFAHGSCEGLPILLGLPMTEGWGVPGLAAVDTAYLEHRISKARPGLNALLNLLGTGKLPRVHILGWDDADHLDHGPDDGGLLPADLGGAGEVNPDPGRVSADTGGAHGTPRAPNEA